MKYAATRIVAVFLFSVQIKGVGLIANKSAKDCRKDKTMKIKIAYQAHEAERARDIEDWIKWRTSLVAKPKVVKSDRHPPFFHTYLTVEFKHTDRGSDDLQSRKP